MRNNIRQWSLLAALWVTLLAGSAFAAAPTAADMSRSVVLGSSVNMIVDAVDDVTFLWYLECIITQHPTNGSVVYQLPQNYPYWTVCLTYTPSNAPCTDTFKYKVRDQEGLWSGEATVTITVLANTAPQSYPLKAIVPANASVTRFLPYHDPDTAQLFTYRILSPPSSGIVTNFKSADTAWPPTAGKFTYVPNPGFTGEDSFTWNVTDGPTTSSTQTARFLVRNMGDHANVSIDVIVNSLVLPEIQTEVGRLVADLQAEGYSAHITPWSQNSAEGVWNHLRAEYDGADFLSGAILIGAVPVPQTDQGLKTDAIYWNMEKYNIPQPGLDAFRPSDRGEIWVSRMYAAASADYGDEATLLKRALNANHDFRTGRSRYLDTARVYSVSAFSGEIVNAESLTSVWTRVDTQVRNDFLPAWTQSGALLQSHSHGTANSYQDVSSASIHRAVAQLRFSLINACSCGAFGGVANNQLLTRRGGNVITVAGSDIVQGAPYIITWTDKPDIMFRERMALGECWGQSLLHALPFLESSTENTIYYGDLSLGAHARDSATGLPFPENQMPSIAGFSQNPAGVVPAGQPVTFSVAVSDPDAGTSDSPFVSFEHQVEWFMNGHNYGRNEPTYTTDDTEGAGWTSVTHVFPVAGAYAIRAEVMDEWQARSWVEMTVIVNTAPVASNDTASVDAGNDVTIPVLANDVESDGETLTVDAITTPPGQGTAVIAGATVVYTATNLSWAGIDTFVYRVRDTAGFTATATVTVTVRADASAPTVVAVSSAGDPTLVRVVFDEMVLPGAGANGAENTANYAIDHGVTISAAALQADGKTVNLTVSTLSEGVAYTLTVDHITDLKSHPITTPQAAGFAFMALQPGVSYEYYEGGWSVLPDFDALTPVKEGTNIVFDISARLHDDNFAFRFTGMIQIDAAGDYTFYTSSDDGSRLYIAPLAGQGQTATLLVDNDGLHGMQERSGTVTLDVGYHNIVVTMFEQGGSEGLEVRWEGPGIAKQIIPAEVLFHYPTAVNTDTDGDGLLDSVDLDDDNDGMSDVDEAVAGTNPTNAASLLMMYVPIVNPGSSSNFVIRWQSASNRWYTVQATTNLVNGFTLNLRTNILSTPPENVHTDSVGTAGQKFYQIRVE